MLMGRFCPKLLTLPPRLQHWESVGVISSGILSTGKGETLVPNTSRRKSQWGPAGAAAQGSSTTGHPKEPLSPEVGRRRKYSNIYYIHICG